MFSGCCCSDSKERGQLNYHPGTDEHVPAPSGEAASPAYLHAEADPDASAPVGQPAAAAAALASDGASTGRSLTDEEREAEKTRIQAMVNVFAKKAVRGCPCTYVSEGSGDRASTQYRIDKGLEYLIIMSPNDSNKAEVTCPISDIEDIYSLVEDGEGCFPPEVLAALKPTEMDMLLMVVYRGSHDKLFRFCLLEESGESRDSFLECLRILCIYAQQAPGPAGGRV